MRRRVAKRLFAGVMLISIAATAVMPLPFHERSAPAECHQAAFPVALVAPSGSAAPECHHGPSDACATMVGCITVPPALAASHAPLTTLLVFGTPRSVAATRLHGRLGIGPPTPPPNS